MQQELRAVGVYQLEEFLYAFQNARTLQNNISLLECPPHRS